MMAIYEMEFEFAIQIFNHHELMMAAKQYYLYNSCVIWRLQSFCGPAEENISGNTEHSPGLIFFPLLALKLQKREGESKGTGLFPRPWSLQNAQSEQRKNIVRGYTLLYWTCAIHLVTSWH